MMDIIDYKFKKIQMQEAQSIEKKVPKAVFIQNVEDACRRQGSQNLLAQLDQQHNKYKLVENQLSRSLQSMYVKMPEIQKTLQMVEALSQTTGTTSVDFMLSQGIFVKGQSKQNLSKIALWLGANTVVQLTFSEAMKLLKQNLGNAKSSSKQIETQLEYIRDQRTTVEVNIARIYNHSLVQKRQADMKKAQQQNQEVD